MGGPVRKGTLRTKEEALACLKEEFDAKSKKSILKEWIIGGRIPEPFQERMVAVPGYY